MLFAQNISVYLKIAKHEMLYFVISEFLMIQDLQKSCINKYKKYQMYEKYQKMCNAVRL